MRALAWSGALLAISACASTGDATGDVRVVVSGEEAAVSGWPVGRGPEAIEFADGWTLAVDRAVVSVDGFELVGADGALAPITIDAALVTLSDGDLAVWELPEIPARRWHDVRWRIVPASASARVIGSADAALHAEMVTRGAALHLAARASHAVHGEVALELFVPARITNRACRTEDGTDGLVVPARSRVTAQLTLHLDHLFFDSLVDPDAAMRFEPWAAVAGEDGVVTLDDLATQSITDLRGVGGAPLLDQDGSMVFYDPGSTPLASRDLAGFVRAAFTTVGHFQGEGHCEYDASL